MSLGLGRPNVIYVKNFMLKDDSHLPGQDNTYVDGCAAQDRKGINVGGIGAAEIEEAANKNLPEEKPKESKECASKTVKDENQELLKSQFKNDENHHSRISKITI